MPKLLAPEYGGVWSWEGELVPSTILKLSDGRELSLSSLITLTNGDVLDWLDDQQIEKHLSGLHDQAAHGRKGPIKAGFDNWNGQINKLFESADKLEAAKFERGNPLQAVIIEAAGFNEKPQVLSQAEFDALEGETLYRGVNSPEQIEDFKTSEVQYAGTGIYANGTYTSNIRETTELYAGDHNNDPDIMNSRIMEMKMLPDANVLTFDNDTLAKFYAKDLVREYEEQYEATGANPAEMQDVQWRFSSQGNWSNLAIMNGVDAIRVGITKGIPEMGVAGESYTIILNRGKVAVNGKS